MPPGFPPKLSGTRRMTALAPYATVLWWIGVCCAAVLIATAVAWLVELLTDDDSVAGKDGGGRAEQADHRRNSRTSQGFALRDEANQ